MKLGDLKVELENLKLHPSKYSIDGKRREDTLCLIFNGITWDILFVERGNDFLFKSYDNEDEACDAFYNKLKSSIRHCNLIDGWYR